MRPYLIVVSGPSGAGKTTLVDKVAAALGDATPVYYDRYAGVAHWHPDVIGWIARR